MKTIEHLWAVIAANPDEEGICGIGSNGGMNALVIGHERNVAMLMASAQALADHTGKTVKVVKFTKTADVQAFCPRAKHGSH